MSAFGDDTIWQELCAEHGFTDADRYVGFDRLCIGAAWYQGRIVPLYSSSDTILSTMGDTPAHALNHLHYFLSGCRRHLIMTPVQIDLFWRDVRLRRSIAWESLSEAIIGVIHNPGQAQQPIYRLTKVTEKLAKMLDFSNVKTQKEFATKVSAYLVQNILIPYPNHPAYLL
jgi:hypothetical protein